MRVSITGNRLIPSIDPTEQSSEGDFSLKNVKNWMKLISVYQFVDEKLFRALHDELKIMRKMIDSFWEGRCYDDRSADEYQVYLKQLHRAHPKMTENVMVFLRAKPRKGDCYIAESLSWAKHQAISIGCEKIELKGEVKKCFRKIRGYYPDNLIQFISVIEANGYEFELMPFINKNGVKSYMAYCYPPQGRAGIGAGPTAMKAVLMAVINGRDKRQQIRNYFAVKKSAYLRYQKEQKWL